MDENIKVQGTKPLCASQRLQQQVWDSGQPWSFPKPQSPPSEGGGRAKSPKSNKKPLGDSKELLKANNRKHTLRNGFFFLIPAETQEERGDFQNANLGGI